MAIYEEPERAGTIGVGITPCPDGSYCCNYGNTTCCDMKRGVFLDDKGNIIGGPSSSLASLLTTLTTTTSATTSATTSLTATSTRTLSPPEGGLTTGAKIGIGVGVPIGLALVGISGAIVYYLRKHLRLYQAARPTGSSIEGTMLPACHRSQGMDPLQVGRTSDFGGSYMSTHSPQSQRIVEPSDEPIELLGHSD